MHAKNVLLKLFIILFSSLGLTWITSCTNSSEKETSQETKDVTITETPVLYSKGFKIETVNGIQKLYILNPFSDYIVENTYVLLKEDQKYPIKENEVIVNVPIKTITPLSSTFYTMIEELNKTESIVAISNASIVFSSSILHNYAIGNISQVGVDDLINVEKLIMINPDVIVASGYSGELPSSYIQLQNAGIPILKNYDWKEATPLARAEWIKFFGALYDEQKLADSIFKQIETNYMAFKSKLDTIDNMPNVLFSSPYQGTWYIPGGNSYVAQFLKDAKGTYPWANDNSTGSIPLNLESVAQEMLDADIWIASESYSLENLKEKDIRHTEFKPFKEGKVYEHDKKRTKAGGDDFWETGALRVDLILKDYINILHPGVLKDSNLTFFRRLD